jgi:hypothetical protein
MTSTDAFAELGRIRFQETTFDDVLARIAELARRTIPGASAVSVTLLGTGGPHTASFDGELGLVLDQWQYEHGHGPCLAAAAANITVLAADLTAERRWPRWAHRAVDAGGRSAVSVGLPVYESVAGALNVYSTEPAAFDYEAVVLAQIFAGYVAMGMANTHLYDGGNLGQHMRDAMDSRATIEQAKGIIIADRRCTPAEASAVLARMAHYAGSTIPVVAATLVSEMHHSRHTEAPFVLGDAG